MVHEKYCSHSHVMCSKSWLIVDLTEAWFTLSQCMCVHTDMWFFSFFMLCLDGSWIQFWDGTRTCQNICILLCILWESFMHWKKGVPGQNLHERNLFRILVLRTHKKIKLRKKIKKFNSLISAFPMADAQMQY